MPPRVTHRAPPINLDLSAAFSRSSNATSRRAAASSCPNPANATPSRAARAPGPPTSSAAASRAATPGLLARYPRIWELSGRTDGPAFPFTRRRTRQRAQKAFRPRPFDDQPTPLTRAVPKIRKTPPTPTATDRGGTVSSSRATHVRYRQIQVGLCCGQRAGASPLLRAGPPASAASVLNASGFCRRQAPSRDPGPPAPEPPYQRSPSPVPCKSRRPGSRRLHAGHHLANNRDTHQVPSPENSQIPSFRCHLNCANDASTAHPQPGFIPRPEASGTSSWSPPDASSAPFPRSLTTTVFS